MELDPEHEEAVFNLGMAYLERGWTRKAQVCFSQALELNPNNLEYEEASQTAKPEPRNSPEMDPSSLQTLQFAENLFRRGKLKQALPHYRQLVRKYPAHYVLLSSFAALNFSIKRFEESLKVARKILTLESVPETVRCVSYTLQMESLRALDRYDEAIEVLEEMTREFPTGPGRAIANYGLAMTMADQSSDLKKAEDLAKQALEQSPPEFRHNALDAMGWVFFKQGRYEEALELLESALSMHETVNHLYHYGMILLALNLREEAFRVFERTFKLRNHNAHVDEFIFDSIQAEMEASGNQEPRDESVSAQAT